MTVTERLSRLLAYLAQDPGNPALLSDIADVQMQAGDWAAACASLDQLLLTRPGDPFTRYRLAVAMRHAGSAAQALGVLEDLLNEGHAQPGLLQETARCRAQLRDWAGALASLRSLDPDELAPEEHDAVRLLRIRAFHQLARLDEAVAEVSSWQTARGGALPLQGHAALATLFLDADKPDDAAAVLRQVPVDVVASNSELAAAAGFVALAQGKLDEAQTQFCRSAEVDPAQARAHLGRALTLAIQGHLAPAVAAMEVAVRAAPAHLGGWHTLAWLHLLMKDLNAAELSFRAALAQDDAFGESHGGLALVAALRGQRETSERHGRTATRLDPQSTNAMVAKTVLEHGASALDAHVLEAALGRFAGVAVRRNPAMREMLARLSPPVV